MINLLPPDTKNSIMYARRNTVLRNWVIATLIGVIGIVLILAVGNIFITRSASTWQKQVLVAQEQLKAQKIEETQTRITDISNSVKLANQVLSKQVLFSTLLNQVREKIPAGSSLQGLSINSAEGGIDLTAVATNYQTATQVQINLVDKNSKLFDKADIVTITCQDSSSSTYPCQVTIRAVFAADSAFKYNSSQKEAKP